MHRILPLFLNQLDIHNILLNQIDSNQLNIDKFKGNVRLLDLFLEILKTDEVF